MIFKPMARIARAVAPGTPIILPSVETGDNRHFLTMKITNPI